MSERQKEIKNKRPQLKVLLAAPRGFCAGVDRAIQIVELALIKYGAPVYVRHEIVHNRFVVDALKAKGAVFVDELDQIPHTQQPVIFSAHGVARKIVQEAKFRNMFVLDATCPLVFKVHFEAKRHFEEGREVLLIGHKGHPEIIGTMGQLPEGAVRLVETAEEARSFIPKNSSKIAYVTQTTLSVDDISEIIDILRERFPSIVGPVKDDICYATTNRQTAVKQFAHLVDCMLVIGAQNSSNSLRLVEVAQRSGCVNSFLIQCADEIPWDKIKGNGIVGITAGASAPEQLVIEVIDRLRETYDINLEVHTTVQEHINFNIPRELRDIQPRGSTSSLGQHKLSEHI